MTESAPTPAEPQPAQPQQKKPFTPTIEDKSFHDLLKSFLGHIFLIANPESFEEGGLGHEITPGWYRAKLVGMGTDYLVVMTEFKHGGGKKASKEPVKQYIPFERIKRISLMKTERLIHI